MYKFIVFFIVVLIFGMAALSQTVMAVALQKSNRKVVQKKESKKVVAKAKALTEKEVAKAKTKIKDKAKAPRKLSRAEIARRAEEAKRLELARAEAAKQRAAYEARFRIATEANIAKDDTAGEDLNVRRTAVNALRGHGGTIVVMETKTGRIVTIVNQEWAIRDTFKPCSTIKLVTGVGGLNEKIITTDGKILDSTETMKLDYALAKSNNAYFQKVGKQMGSVKFTSYARRLGLEQKTGINTYGEKSGRVPHGNENARIYSHGDDSLVTPIQLAVLVTALTDKGHRKVTPKIVRESDQSSQIIFENKPIDLPAEDLDGVVPGMKGSADYGTGRRVGDIHAAGKTGSCLERGSWVGLFASVAPVEDPKYSVVVVTRGQNERGKYAAEIAGKVYQALSLQAAPVQNPQTAQVQSRTDILQ